MPYDHDSGNISAEALEAALRAAVRGFLERNRERLICAARRIGGGDGAALACAFKDIVADADYPPPVWPVEELIELLERGLPGKDHHVPRMIARLRIIAEEVEHLAAAAAAEN
jgi:hypothetical protein